VSRARRRPPIDAQFQTLQRIDGPKGKATKKKCTRTARRKALTVAASAEEDAGFKAGKDL
jgi:hypothetical protein